MRQAQGNFLRRMQSNVSIAFKLIKELPPVTVWKQASSAQDSPVCPEQSVRDHRAPTAAGSIRCCPSRSAALPEGSFQGFSVARRWLLPLPLGLAPVWLLLLSLPATERSRRFSYQGCSVSRSTHCSLPSHPKHFSRLFGERDWYCSDVCNQ